MAIDFNSGVNNSDQNDSSIYARRGRSRPGQYGSNATLIEPDATTLDTMQAQAQKQAGVMNPNQILYDPQRSDTSSLKPLQEPHGDWGNRELGQANIEKALDDVTPYNPGESAQDTPPSINSAVEQYNTFIERLLSLGELAGKIDELTRVTTALLTQLYRQRMVEDTNVMISSTQEYEVNYHDHTFLFIYSNTAITLVLNQGGTKPVAANTWVGINFSKGMKLTAQGINAPGVMVTIRATDTLLALT